MVVHVLLVNLTTEVERLTRRALQQAWGPSVHLQTAAGVESALEVLRETTALDEAHSRMVAFLATGSYGEWDPAAVEMLRDELALHQVPLIGLADTSLALERLHARRAPLDAALLSPVQPVALRELGEALNLTNALSAAVQGATLQCRHAVAETRPLMQSGGWIVRCVHCGALVVCHRALSPIRAL